MGGTESKNSAADEFLSTHMKVKTYYDDRYGKVSVYLNKLKEEENYVLLTNNWTKSQNAEMGRLGRIAQNKKLKNNSISAIIYDFKKIESSNFADYTKHYIGYEYSPMILQKEIQRENAKKVTDRKVTLI